MTEPEENYADAVVLCRDGKYRTFAIVLCRDGKYRAFVAAADEVLHYEARKYTYLLMPEPEGRGFVTMRATADMGPVWEYVVAPERMQPVKIEAKTRYGRWDWEIYG